MQLIHDPHNGSLSWSRVALIAITIGAIALIAVFSPVARQALEQGQAQRAREFYSSGLSPSDCALGEVDELIRKYAPGEPNTTIVAFHTFSNPEAIRIVGNRLYYFALPSPREKGDAGRPHIESSIISNETSDAVATLVASDIGHAQAELPLGFDGTTYVFRSGARNCAVAWSPEPTTRAGKLVSLFYKLMGRAKTPTAGENEILTTAIALEGP